MKGTITKQATVSVGPSKAVESAPRKPSSCRALRDLPANRRRQQMAEQRIGGEHREDDRQHPASRRGACPRPAGGSPGRRRRPPRPAEEGPFGKHRKRTARAMPNASEIAASPIPAAWSSAPQPPRMRRNTTARPEARTSAAICSSRMKSPSAPAAKAPRSAAAGPRQGRARAPPDRRRRSAGRSSRLEPDAGLAEEAQGARMVRHADAGAIAFGSYSSQSGLVALRSAARSCIALVMR